MEGPVAGAEIRVERRRLLLAAVLLLLTLQLLFPFRVWTILLVTLGGSWLFGRMWARELSRSLHLAREHRYGWAQVGDRLEERFTLSNDGWAPAIWVELEDHSTLPGAVRRQVRGVGALAQSRWTMGRDCTRRGRFLLGPTTLRTGDPFGWFTVIIHESGSLALSIVPPIVPLPPILLDPSGRGGEGQPRPRQQPEPVHVASVRAADPGEGLRRIHWPTTARLGTPHVRSFEGAPVGDWWLFLDASQATNQGRGPDSTLEKGIILAASLAAQAIAGGKGVGLAANGRSLVWRPPRAGRGDQLAILRDLARIEPGEASLAHLLRRFDGALSDRLQPILIAPTIEPQTIEALMALLRRGIRPTVLLVAPDGEAGSEQQRQELGRLAALGIAAQRIDPALLTAASTGERGRWRWRVLATGRVVVTHRPEGQEWQRLA